MGIKKLSGPTGPYAHGYLMCRVQYPDGIVKMVTYHRYLYERAYGILPPDVVVHHKNGNKSDNTLSNLEAMTRGIHTANHQPLAELVEIECLWCKTKVTKSASSIRHNQVTQKKAGPFCSKSCAATWSREYQLDRISR